MRYKRPDRKNALSIAEAAERDMRFTLSMEISEASGSTIVRNIYECFRMLGDSLLVLKGIKSEDHITPIKELTKVEVKTDRPVNLIDNLRRLRHNINYYGYKPKIQEVKDVISIAESTFQPLLRSIRDRMKE
jgi:uncharacterized protein (UPF0332 family)